MFDALRRLQLQRRGFSCGKTRRKKSDSELLETLRYSPWVKGLAFVGFAAALSSLTVYSPTPGSVFEGQPVKAMGVIVVVFVVALVQFFANHPNSFRRNSRVFLIFGLMLLQVAIAKAICFLVPENDLPEPYTYILVPYALGPLALSVLLGRTQGVFVAVFASLWGCLVVPAEWVYPFLIASLVSGFVAVYVSNEVRQRSRLVRAGFYVGITGLVLALVLGFIEVPSAAYTQDEWRAWATQVATVLLVGTATATFVSGTLPMLETMFHVTTDISWIELADLNHPLLKRMTIEAPGTYHHSLVVANLAEAAAEAVGANATMCRVCAYFHDIGKLSKPEYFVENISEGHNPHDDLTPTMSALVIAAHVKDGVDLALKHNLKTEIIDVIEQHHGNSLIYFFYRRALDQQEEARRQVGEGSANEEDIPEVSEKSFRYPGPKPQTKESAIISLADALESASRSVAKPTPSRIEQLINEITQGRISDGQLEECDLTFGELEGIKRSFAATLRSMLHNRVAYPKAGDGRQGRGGETPPVRTKTKGGKDAHGDGGPKGGEQPPAPGGSPGGKGKQAGKAVESAA